MLDNIKHYKKDLIYIILLLVLLFALTYSVRSCIAVKNEAKQNVIALTDSIDSYVTKANDIVYTKNLLEGEMSTLKQTNAELYKKLEDMKCKKSDQTVYIQTEIKYTPKDTILVPVYRNDTLIADFDFSDKYRTLTGTIRNYNDSLELTIDIDKIYFDYTLAIKDSKVHLSSNNPYVKPVEIQGITISQSSYRKKKFHVGPSINVGYNPLSNHIVPSIGISLTYSIFSF